MNKTISILLSALAAGVLLSCGDAIEIPKVDAPADPEKDPVFDEPGALGGAMSLRGVKENLLNGQQPRWVKGETISLYDGESVITATNEHDNTANARFKVTVQENAKELFALYPSLENVSLAGNRVSLEIPAEQRIDTPTPLYMVAKASGHVLSFRNLFAVINVGFDFEGVDRVVITSTDYRTMAGKIEVRYDNFDPEIEFVDFGARSVSLSGTFAPNEYYPIVVPPLSTGYKLVAYSDGDEVAHSEGESLTLEAGGSITLSSVEKDPEPDPGFDWNALPGTWNVYGGNSAPYGLWVLGGSGGDPAFVSPLDKNWNWNSSYKCESDNELTIKITGKSGTKVTGTINWTGGADGKFWDYLWVFQNASKPEYEPYYNTDLSKFYDKIPKGETAFSMDLVTLVATLSNGEMPKFLIPGTHEFAASRTRTVPEGCFGLAFHLGEIKSQNPTWYSKDIDRFMFCPLEYVIFFEKL